MRSSATAAANATSRKSRLDIQQLKVRILVEQYRSGHLVVPEFQRDFVWKANRAPRLIDSLHRGYPISMFLVWTSDAESRSRRSDPRPVLGKMVSWLIDGQQRVITLARVLSGDEGLDVVYNPDQDRFRLSNATVRRSDKWFRVSEILDDKTYRQIRRALSEDPIGQSREARFDQLRRIMDYEIPVVRMIDHSFEEAVDAFTRINTLGLKLKLEDLASAHVAAKHSGFIADEVAPFVTKIQSHGFSRLNVMHLFRACAFVASPDGRSRTPLHELSSTEVTQAWSRIKRATEEAILIVRDEFGLTNMDMLWSGALLVPVIALCASTSPATRDPQSIAGWLAVAALSHRYSKGTDTLDQDLRACRSDDPIGRLLANVRKDGRELQALPGDFNGKSYDRGGLFGVYVACRHAGLRDIVTGSAIVSPGNVERHHILPRAQFAINKRNSADTLANIAFVNGDTTRATGAVSPDASLGKLSRDLLASQCIPTDRNLWRVEKADAFWEARRSLLASAFNDFLRTRLRGRRIAHTRAADAA